jgi:Family of unknown function (DUF6159)
MGKHRWETMAFESIGQALKYIGECFRMVLEEPKLLVPSFVAVILGAFLGIAVVIASIFFNVFSQSGLSPFFLFFLIIALVCSFTVNYLFTAVASFAIYEHVKFGRSSLVNALKRATSRWHIILALAIIAAVVSAMANSMKNNNRRRRGIVFGMLAPILGTVLEEGWKVASMLLIPVAVISGLGFVDTFKKAFDIARNNLVLIGAGEVGIRILTGIFGFLGVVLSILMAFGLYMLLAGLNAFLAIAVAVVFAFMAISFVTTINQFVRISFYTLAYAWAEERLEHGSPTAAAPIQLKNAFGV